MNAGKHSQNNWLRLRIQPNASRNEIISFTDNVLLVKVAASPVKGKANRELVAFLSQALGLSKSSLSIVKGHTSRTKVIAIDGLSQEEITNRLKA